MRSFWVLLVLMFMACQDGQRENSLIETEDKGGAADVQKTSVEQSYRNAKFGLSFDYPAGYRVYEGVLPGDVPVINVYKSGAAAPPLAIHEDMEMSYIAFLPEGYGVDGPGGARKNFVEWNGKSPVNLNVDPVDLKVYLLENGSPWAFYLTLENPPEKWRGHGGIFVHYGVKDFESKCFDTEEEKYIAPADCDPLMGDSLEFYGKVSVEEREAINQVLGSLEFISSEE